jgi:hypothetical protein
MRQSRSIGYTYIYIYIYAEVLKTEVVLSALVMHRQRKTSEL